MKSLTRYPKRAAWLPSWLSAPFGRLADRWTAATAPYDEDAFDPDNPLPYELHVLRYAGRIGLGMVMVPPLFFALELWFGGVSMERLPTVLSNFLSVGVMIGAGVAVYVVSRIHRRRCANIAIATLLAWLALAASPLWHLGWKIPVTLAVPSLLALLSYWKEFDP